MVETELIENKKLRDEMVSKVEVLERVGNLLLMPGTEFMNVAQVAEYYEVAEKTIQTIYLRHKTELDEDGITSLKQKEFLIIQNEELEKTQSTKGKITLFYKDGQIIDVPNRGLKVFPKRAVLRIGMLLRDSEVAREVRTQLLNIEEKVDNHIKTYDINEQNRLTMNCLEAYSSGDVSKIMNANSEYIAFQNRHIQILEPKAEKYENFLGTDGLKSINEVAKEVGLGEYKLFKFLRNRKVFYQNSIGTNLPYQKYVDDGRFVVKERRIKTNYYSVTYATPKGMDFVYDLLKKYNPFAEEVVAC